MDNSTITLNLPLENSTTFKVFLLLISTPLITLTLVGNSLVILTWIFQKSLRTPSNLYLVSLAVADLITGLFAFPPTVHYSYVQRWVYGLGVCRVWLVMCFSMYSITAFHLVAIALDRYQTITEGVTYFQRRTLKSVFEKLLIIWVLGVWVPLPVILDWEHISKDPTGQKNCVSKKIPYWVAHYCCSSFWFPAIFLVRIYYKVYLEIQKRLRSRIETKAEYSSSNIGTELTSEDLKIFDEVSITEPSLTAKSIKEAKLKVVLDRERRSAVTLIIISGAFLFCWVPWNSLSLYDVLAPKEAKPEPYLYMSAAIFGLANSCINPIVYAARIPEFRSALKKLFRVRR